MQENRTSNRTKISLNSVEKYIWALYANRTVSCIFARCSGVWILRSIKQLSNNKRLIYTFRSSQNMCYFDTELIWRINMELSKHLWSILSLRDTNRKSCNWSANCLVAVFRQLADVRMRTTRLMNMLHNQCPHTQQIRIKETTCAIFNLLNFKLRIKRNCKNV